MDELGDWKKRETLQSALVQLGAVALVLGVTLTIAYRRGEQRQISSEAIESARKSIRLDTAQDLRAALKALEPAFTNASRISDAHAVAARIEAELALVHGDASAAERAKAEFAEAEGSPVEEHATAAGLIALLDGKPADAIAVLEPLTHGMTSRAEISVALARAQLAAGQKDAAAATLSQASENAVRDPRVHALRGDLLMGEGLVDRAAEEYQRALIANAQHPGARFGMALAHAKKNHAVGELDSVVASLRESGTLTVAMEQTAAQAKAAAAMATDTP